MLHGKKFSDLESSTTPQAKIKNSIIEYYSLESADLESYFSKNIQNLPNPFLLPDFLSSVDLILQKISSQSKILLFGDKDTDGISSTSILGNYLRKIHKGILNISNSTSGDDYGLCAPVVKRILNDKPDLLITLDFGTSNYEEINYLSSQGIEVIVLDHHEIPVKIPNCKLINPKREDSIYPEKKICTSSIASKLVLGLLVYEIIDKSEYYSENLFYDKEKKFRDINIYELLKKYPDKEKIYYEYLSLSSIGTITDMMPLRGENRIVLEHGLKSLVQIMNSNETSHLGLKLLLIELKLNPEKITSKDIGWSIGPVLNAAGRMGKTEIALKLLLSPTEKEAKENLKLILELNNERKERTKRNLYKVEEYFKRKPERTSQNISFCYEPDLEPGVSGIVATRLVETYKKPAIFITPENGEAKGSIRSYSNENVLELLNLTSDLLLHYGGHKEAGGFSIQLNKIKEFETKAELLSAEWLKNSIKKVEQKYSAISFSPSEIDEKVFQVIDEFQPFGLENEEPILSIRDAQIINFKFMGENKHARFNILGVNPKIKFVIWNKAYEFNELLNQSSKIQIFGILEENFFNKQRTIQFLVKEFYI
jgi:single-stranded-DNA-specific exonuclease